jgi:K+-transporting ATPase ATPase A chain
MTANGIVQIAACLAVLLLLAWPLGIYMARVYAGERVLLTAVVGPLERAIYRLARIDSKQETGWRSYAAAMLVFNLLGIAVVFALQLLQQWLPLNPAGLGAVAPDSAFNTAVSFATNTNWQGYGGETTMSLCTQMAALTVQNFVSAASGMAVLLPLVRGFVRGSSATVGNFWVDLVRSTLYVLLPLAVVLAVALIGQGVPQTLQAATVVTTLDAGGLQNLALGPVASQVAIKQLGTNGGGFFNVNSAHPFENPTALANLLETLAILLIPAALCTTFGRLVRDSRQGLVLLLAMLVIFVPITLATLHNEQQGNPALQALGVDTAASAQQSGGNMEGKEVRFGIAASALWAVATTAASNGSVNAMHDSFSPLGGLWPMWLMQLGEVVFGGVGSGLYGLLLFAIVAVFIAGLMVGRTPEYLGKKIDAFEMKMASLAILLPCVCVLFGTALAVATAAGRAGVANPGAHGFSEILYAFSSASNNNGSAFNGLSANTPFYNLTLAAVMLVGRYGVAVPVLAIAGSLARKRSIPHSSGTLPTHGPLFLVLLVGVVLMVGALTFLPALALGPIVEHLQGGG